MADINKPENASQTAAEPAAAQQPPASNDRAQNGAEAAAKQYADDQAWKAEHPNEPLIRGANPEVGGE